MMFDTPTSPVLDTHPRYHGVTPLPDHNGPMYVPEPLDVPPSVEPGVVPTATFRQRRLDPMRAHFTLDRRFGHWVWWVWTDDLKRYLVEDATWVSAQHDWMTNFYNPVAGTPEWLAHMVVFYGLTIDEFILLACASHGHKVISRCSVGADFALWHVRMVEALVERSPGV